MRSWLLALSPSAAAVLALSACGPPINNTPASGVPQLKTLAEVMDVQATTADPQFGKAEQASFTDAEFASLAETGTKIDATSKRIKAFTKGPGFDALADKLNQDAVALSTAAGAKDAAGARAAIASMKATCKQCHSEFR
jgi:cytochrome c556